MAKEARIVEGAYCDTVQYAHSSAVAVGEVIFVAGIGALVCGPDALSANEEGTYYKAGRFQMPISTGTVSQGEQLYWDVSANKLIAKSSEDRGQADFFVGSASSAGTGTAGYVDVDINVVLPEFYLDKVGEHVCINTMPVPDTTLETITVTGLTTYDAVMALIKTAGTTKGAYVQSAKATAANTAVVGLSTTQATGSGTLQYFIYRRVAPIS
jgi:hypothetical protein